LKRGDDFLINGLLGECDPQDEWHSVDRIKFSLLQPLALNLSLDPQTIAEVVRFDSAGNASVVGSIEYGTQLQLNLHRVVTVYRFSLRAIRLIIRLLVNFCDLSHN
jgi:hypothetical protein